MRAHLVQLDIVWEEPGANFARVERLLDSAPIEPGDLVLLPEMFDTGFSFNIERTADRGATVEFLTRLAQDLGVTVQGGRTAHACSCTRATNRATVVGPAGGVLCDFAKVHPFSFGGEAERFVGGTEVMTYRWEGPGRKNDAGAVTGDETLIVCPAVCYDLRFPELFRLGLTKGAEVFAIGANWPEARQAHWRALLVARAIENQAVVLGVNRTGRDPHLGYVGGSIGVGPKGEVLGELEAEEDVLSVEVQGRAIRSWREAFPAWRDARLMPGAPASPLPTRG